MKAVILCGGLGKRLRPLTNRTPKAMIPLRGKPIIERIVRSLYQCGLREIIVVVGHLGHKIEEFLQDGHRFNVEISYIQQDQCYGSADALDSARNLCDHDFVVTSCDILLPRGRIESLIAAHYMWRNSATLSLARLEIDEIVSLNTVAIGHNHQILAILEKPSIDEVMSQLSSTSLYVLNRSVFDYLPLVPKSPRDEFEIASAIDMMITNGLSIRSVVTDEWLHLSTLDDFLRFNGLRDLPQSVYATKL